MVTQDETHAHIKAPMAPGEAAGKEGGGNIDFFLTKETLSPKFSQ